MAVTDQDRQKFAELSNEYGEVIDDVRTLDTEELSDATVLPVAVNGSDGQEFAKVTLGQLRDVISTGSGSQQSEGSGGEEGGSGESGGGSGLTLGETSSTAYRGDRGKIAYDHSQRTMGNPHNVTKSDVGLGNVTNDAQVKRSEMGVASGVASLDASGKVPSAQLPSYVDDVIEGYLHDGKFYTDSLHTTEITGESGKIYVNLATNKSYRWSGSAYTPVGSSDISGIKVGASGSAISPSGGVITIPAYEENAQAHKSPTADEVKSALGTGSGTSKFLREDGTWATPPASSGATADEEDLTNANGVLKLKNRASATGQKGMKILRQGSTFASQVTSANTIYVIRYAFDLDAGTVTMPAGSVLRFDGGSISGGTLNCNGTIIEGQKGCFGSGVKLTGSINSDFRVSWLTLVQGYDYYNIECLSGLCEAVTKKVVWDVPQIYILHKANISIPIKPGITDFGGTKFLCKATVDNGVLFEYSETATAITGSTIAALVANSAFTDKCGYLIVEDGTAVADRIGYDPAYRKDILCVKDNRASNNTVMPYDDGDSVISASYFYGDYNTITVRNFSVERDSSATKVSKIIRVTNAHDVVISDVAIQTPESSFYGGRDMEITSVYNLTLRNINTNGSYSTASNYGYVYTLNTIFNLVCDNLCGDALWGVFGCNNMNRVNVRNSQINRFDCHCYSRDFLFTNCDFAHLYNQIGVHFGYVKFECCTFTSFIPLSVDDSYCSMPKYEVVFEDCTFSDTPYIVNVPVSKSTFDDKSHRSFLSEYNLPNIKLGGVYNLTRNSFILRKAANYTECPSFCKVSIDGLTINAYNSTYLAVVSSSLSNVIVDINRLRYELKNGITLYTLYGLEFSNSSITLSNLKVSVNNSYFPTNHTLKKDFYDGTDALFVIENSVIPVSTWNAYSGVEYINCTVVCRWHNPNFAVTPAILYKNCKFKKETDNSGYLVITSDMFYHFQNCAFDVQPRYFNLYKNIDCFVSDNVISEGFSEGITSTELTALFTAKENGATINRFKCYNTTTHKLEYYINKTAVSREVFFGEGGSGGGTVTYATSEQIAALFD